MIPGVGPVASSALRMGSGAISSTVRAAGNPLVVGALQGAAANVRAGRDQVGQTAATQGRANFTLSTAGLGRGALAPPGTVLGNGAIAPSDPRSRDFSAELNAVPANLPSDLRQDVVHKTVDARGRPPQPEAYAVHGAVGVFVRIRWLQPPNIRPCLRTAELRSLPICWPLQPSQSCRAGYPRGCMRA